MKLGERYKMLRLTIKNDLGEPISIKDFANNCVNLASSRISELENNKRDMSLTELKAYHNYFKVSYEYLLGETDVQSTNEDIKTACRVTGLSQTTIEELIRLTEADYNVKLKRKNAFEKIINNIKFRYILDHICAAAQLPDADSSIMMSTLSYNPSTNKYDFRLSKEDAVEYMIQMVLNEFRYIIKKIVKEVNEDGKYNNTEE